MGERHERDPSSPERDPAPRRPVERAEKTEKRDRRDCEGRRLREGGAHVEVEREIRREEPGGRGAERRELRGRSSASEPVDGDGACGKEQSEGDLDRIREAEANR